MNWQYSKESQINRESNTLIFGHMQDATDVHINSVGMPFYLMQA